MSISSLPHPAVDGLREVIRLVGLRLTPCRAAPVPAGLVGVGVKYNYRFVTPLSAAMGFFGGGQPASIPLAERAVMAMNPR